MKKILLASALVLAIAVSAAVAQEVLSQNAVGYIKVPTIAGKFISVAQPLNNMGKAENKFGETSIGQELPAGSEVFFWSAENQGWSGGAKSGKGWQPAQFNKVVAAGEGFFLKEKETVTTITTKKPYTWP